MATFSTANRSTATVTAPVDAVWEVLTDPDQIARLTPFLQAKGIGAETAKAGCSRCNACSPMAAVERSLLQIGPKPVAAARV